MTAAKKSVFELMANPIILLARVLLSSSFLLSAYDKIIFFPDWVSYLVDQELPNAELLGVVGIAIELIGAVAILIGLQTRVVALTVALVCIGTTFLHRTFWSASVDLNTFQMLIFAKDLSVAGGLLALAVVGPKEWSLDGFIARRRKSD